MLDIMMILLNLDVWYNPHVFDVPLPLIPDIK